MGIGFPFLGEANPLGISLFAAIFDLLCKIVSGDERSRLGLDAHWRAVDDAESLSSKQTRQPRPALVFALAGVGALRLGRRFTLRLALIATTVVAVLLGMAVGL